MPRLSDGLSYAADLRIATSSLMTPDQKMGSPEQAREAEAQDPFARAQGGVRAVEGWHVYVESRRAYAETVVAQPGSPTCGESHYANTGCIASAEAATTSAQFASHARVRHARLGK